MIKLGCRGNFVPSMLLHFDIPCKTNLKKRTRIEVTVTSAPLPTIEEKLPELEYPVYLAFLDTFGVKATLFPRFAKLYTYTTSCMDKKVQLWKSRKGLRTYFTY